LISDIVTTGKAKRLTIPKTVVLVPVIEISFLDIAVEVNIKLLHPISLRIGNIQQYPMLVMARFCHLLSPMNQLRITEYYRGDNGSQLNFHHH